MSINEKRIGVCCFVVVGGVVETVGDAVGSLEKYGVAVEEAGVDEVFVYLSVSHMATFKLNKQ